MQNKNKPSNYKQDFLYISGTFRLLPNKKSQSECFHNFRPCLTPQYFSRFHIFWPKERWVKRNLKKNLILSSLYSTVSHKLHRLIYIKLKRSSTNKITIKNVSVTFILPICKKNFKRKAVELTLGCTRVSSTNFIQILSLNFERFLTDRLGKWVVNKDLCDKGCD